MSAPEPGEPAIGAPALGAHRPLPSLAGAAWLVRPSLQRVFDVLEAGGGAARIVGGAVRNALIARPVGEVDVATTLPPDMVMRLAAAAGVRAVATGIDHGTVTLVVDGDPYEVTTLRRDVATDGRRAVVAFTTDWAEDAGRRDFTMNALYAARGGAVFDPLGGLADLMARRVRFIGDPHIRIREDYLRILRLFRFHAEIGAGPLDPAGLAAAAELKAGLAGLSRERVGQELLRLLAAPGAPAALAEMEQIGLLSALGLGRARIRRLSRLAEIEARLGAPADAILRLAALLLDAPQGHDAVGLAKRLRLSRAERDRLAAIGSGHGLAPAMPDAKLKEQIYRDGPRAVRDRALIAFAAADAAPGDPAWRAVLDLIAGWPVPRFPLRGRDLAAAGIASGPAIGTRLAELEAAWIASGFSLPRAELLGRLVP